MLLRVCMFMLPLLLHVSVSFAASEPAPHGALRGRISDSITGRPIAGAKVILNRGSAIETTASSDANGSFAFDPVHEGVHVVDVISPNYLRASQSDVRVVLNKVAMVDFALVRTSQETLAEVVVSARAPAEDGLSTANSVHLNREEIRRAAGSGGDVLRALDMMPGVMGTGEFSSFTVRGNGPRDNLILVDGIPFDKVVHFDQSIGEQDDVAGGGRFSIFAPDIIGGATFSPGAWRAAEGGKYGSLLELEIAEGNRVSSTVGARVDIVGPELDYEGPSYIADNTSVLLSARQFDFTKLFETIGETGIGEPKLSDVIFKSVTDLDPEHRLEFLAIQATEDYTRDVEDVLESREDVKLIESEQDSRLFGFTWRWSPGSVAKVRNALFYRDSNKTGSEGEAYPEQAGRNLTVDSIPVRRDILRIVEQETEIGWRGDFSTVLPSGVLTAGARVSQVELDFNRVLSDDWIRYVFDDSDFRPDPAQKFIVLRPADINSSLRAKETRLVAYSDYAHDFGSVIVTPGLRFEHDGFADQSLVSPRLNATWHYDAVTRIWAGAGMFYQAPRYLDLAADPDNAGLKNERSVHLAIGYARYLSNDLRFTAEAYHQRLSDLIVFDDRTTNKAANLGEGTNSGVDFMLTKRMTNTWSAAASYSYSHARRNDNLGKGDYDADWDRPHSVGLAAAWEPNDRWTFSAKWRYASGPPSDSFIVHDDVLGAPSMKLWRYSKQLTTRNTERLTDFHSLSLRADYRRRFGPLSAIAFVDVINVYGHQNANGLEWNERHGINEVSGLSEPLPFIGLKFEYSWTARH